MKKITITGTYKIQQEPDFEGKGHKMTVLGPEDMEVSDGYHTMDELYTHRINLYIALCKALDAVNLVSVTEKMEHGRFRVWRSKEHYKKKETMYEGWFIMGIGEEKGKQISYHLPIEYWDDTEFAETLDYAPKFDGHSSYDVIDRLKIL